MGQDDLANFHAALRAQDVSPGLRLVMRIFNTGLGERMRSFFPDCAVLSSSSMAAPSFVAAALGEPAPSHVRVAGRTLFVARPGEADAAHLVCGLATTGAPGHPRLLPPDQDLADLVLAVADGTPRNPLTRQRRRPAAGPRGPAPAPASGTSWGSCSWPCSRSWWPVSCCSPPPAATPPATRCT